MKAYSKAQTRRSTSCCERWGLRSVNFLSQHSATLQEELSSHVVTASPCISQARLAAAFHFVSADQCHGQNVTAPDVCLRHTDQSGR
jgi:hypothetical protein